MAVYIVSGSHRQCGIQIGQKYRQVISEAIDDARSTPPSGLTWEQALIKAGSYWENTKLAYPLVAEEIEGVAEGAEEKLLEIFAYMVEELWSTNQHEAKACSDILLCHPITDGRIIIGHNNDLSESFRDKVFPIEWHFDDDTSMFTVGPLGFYISAGVNNSGVALTGNELTQTDLGEGIPRSIIARAILLAKNYEDAVKVATDTRRASSYNNIISTSSRAVGVEGSKTAYELIEPIGGFYVHTNHYLSTKMLEFEAKPNYLSSINRLSHARSMIQQRHGAVITAQDMERMLSDHNGGGGDDNSICRHGESSVTVFGIVIDFAEGIVRLAMGNPCEAKFETVWKFL